MKTAIMKMQSFGENRKPTGSSGKFFMKNLYTIPTKLYLILFIILLTPSLIFAQSQVISFIPAGNSAADLQKTYQIPACVTTITVGVWGGSGAGRNGSTANPGGGGGGGAYSQSTLTVTPGTTYSIQLGALGAPGDGGDTWFALGATKYVLAKGGKASTGTAGGLGGAASAGTGTIKYSGGAGGAGTGNVGGGGGSTAGPGGNGNAGSSGSGSVGGAGGTPVVGNNGGGAVGGNNNGDGNTNQTCFACGGGGGGGIAGTGTTNAGYGSFGMASITLPALLNVTVGSPQTICPGTPQAFTATGSGGNTSSYNYKWQYNNVDTTNAGAWTNLTGFLPSNTYSPASISQTTWYRAIITETTGCVHYDTSASVQVYVQQLSADLQFSQTICNSSIPTPVSITTSPASAVPNFVWYRSTTSPTSGFSAITGTVSVNTYTPGVLTGTEYYMAIVNATGCATINTNTITLTTSTVAATCDVGRNPAVMYNTNSLPMFRAWVGGSVTTGAWSILSGGGSLSTTSQTNNPAGVEYTAAPTYTGTVVLQLTTNPNGCGTQCVSTKTINVLNNTVQTVSFTAPGTGTWTVPGCVTTITVGAWGAGGGGGTGGCGACPDGSGGGGGAYSASKLTVTQGTTYSISVGAGGVKSLNNNSPATKGGNGQGSWFAGSLSSEYVFAQGGIGGLADGQPGYGSNSLGGQATAGSGNIEKRSGGDGESPGAGCNWAAGGGGSSAGPGYDGNTAIDVKDVHWGGGAPSIFNDACDYGSNNALNTTIPGGAAPPTEAGAGGVGGYSGPDVGGRCINNAIPLVPSVGGFPGGGGGGGTNDCDSDGEQGGNGQVKIWYTTSNPVILYLSVSPSATICQGGSITLTGDSDYPVQYSWAPGGATTAVMTASPTVTTTYTLTDLSGCAPPISQTIVVNPPLSVTLTPTAGATICAGTTGTLSAAVTASLSPTYTWTGPVGGVTTTLSTTATMTATPTITTTYTVNINTNTCAAVRTNTIIVNPLPSLTVTSVPICRGQSATLTASGAASYLWSTTATTATMTATPTITTTYSVTGTTNGCSSVRTGTITVNPLPTGTVSGATAICLNGTAPVVSFAGSNGTAPYTYTYKLNAGGNQTVTSPGTSTTVTVPNTPAGNYTYSLVSVQDVNTCSNTVTSSTTFTVNTTPTADMTTTATVVCLNGTQPVITFTASAGNPSYKFNYKLTDISGTTNYTVTTAAASSTYTLAVPTNVAGTFTYSLTGVQDAALTSCGSANRTITIIVNPLPTATVSGATAICLNATAPIATFTASGGTAPYTYTYKLNAGGNQTVTSPGTSTTVTVPNTPAGNYTYSLVSVQDVNTCSNTVTSSTTFTVNTTPTADMTTTATVVCLNGTQPVITFTASAGNPSYKFNYKLTDISGTTNYTVTTAAASSTYTLAVPTNVAGTFTYSLTGVQDAALTSCGSANKTITITVNPLPTATLTGNNTICQGSASTPLTFTGANGTAPYTFNYTENGVAASITSPGTSTVLSISASAAATYTHTLVSVSDANGCSQNQPQTTYIRINPSPFGAISGSTNICQGSATSPSILFTGSNGTTPYKFTYSINGTTQPVLTTAVGSSTISFPTSTATAGTTTYSLMAIEDANNAGCGSVTTALAAITVDPSPTISTNGNSLQMCANTTVTIGSGEVSGLNYSAISWGHNGSGSITSVGTGSLTPTYASSLSDGGTVVTLTVTATGASSCNTYTTSATYPITVNLLPTAVITGSATVCQGDPAPAITFSITSTGTVPPYIFNYSLNNASIEMTTQQTDTTVILNTTNSGTYVYSLVSVKDKFCFNNQSGSQTIMINKLPSATIASSTPAVCQNATAPIITLTGIDGTAPYTFTVTGAPSLTLTSTSGSKGFVTVPTVDSGTFVYTLTGVSYNNGKVCSKTLNSSVTVRVNPLPVATMQGGKELCKDSLSPIITFKGGPLAKAPYTPYTFTFAVNNGKSTPVVSNSSGVFNLSVPTDKVGTFNYTLLEVKDALKCSRTITTNSVVPIVIHENPYASFQVTPEVTSILEPEITITNASLASDIYKWEFGDRSMSPSKNPESHTYADTGHYRIKLLVTTNFGCKDSTYEKVIIELPFLLYIPNTFSPNDDGVNDTFTPHGDGLIKFKMMIYDRWGNMAFYSDDINKGWDGKANGGSQASLMDTYVYVITVTDLKKHEHIYRGVVNLIK